MKNGDNADALRRSLKPIFFWRFGTFIAVEIRHDQRGAAIGVYLVTPWGSWICVPPVEVSQAGGTLIDRMQGERGVRADGTWI